MASRPAPEVTGEIATILASAAASCQAEIPGCREGPGETVEIAVDSPSLSLGDGEGAGG